MRQSGIAVVLIRFIISMMNEKNIHDTLIVVDRYLRLMGDKTIPDSAKPRLESCYPPLVAGIEVSDPAMNISCGCCDTQKLRHFRTLLCEII